MLSSMLLSKVISDAYQRALTTLPKDVYEDELLEMFEEYGVVNIVKIIKDRHTKKSRGYAFVKMDDKNAALKAIEEWDEGSIDDQIIIVQEAKLKKRAKKR